MSDQTSPRDAAAVIEVAKQAQRETMTLREVDPDLQYITVDESGNARILDLEKLRDTPDRPRGTYHPATVGSLIDYVDEHQNGYHTTLWVHATEGKVLAILDDNAGEATAWREHRAELELLLTEEWKFWTAHDGAYMGQQEFAEKLQEGLPDISRPDGADLLEICSTIQATTNSTFRSGFRLENGEVKMQYDEQIDGKAGKAGELAIPEEFTLLLAPFIGNEPVDVKAHLRYRVRGGNLTIGYKLQQPDRIIQDALDAIAKRLGAKFDRVYRGTPA
jgi:uncharacterized protein YfdQ (DUF2303 family)